MFVLTGPWCGLERQLGVGFVPARLDFLVLKTPFSCYCACFLVLLSRKYGARRAVLPATAAAEMACALLLGPIDRWWYWSPCCHVKIRPRISHYHAWLIFITHLYWKWKSLDSCVFLWSNGLVRLDSCIHSQILIRLGWRPAPDLELEWCPPAHPKRITNTILGVPY